jgi:AcrR family transcriptional regulator
MSPGVINYSQSMGRWQPDAQGRLQEAALHLYAEQGYDETTVAEIAARAGLTKRTFFRHFADKREVLFFGSQHFQETFVAGVSGAPAGASPMEAVVAGLVAIGSMLDQERGREFVTLRQRTISANPELQERELIKLAAVASATTDALVARGSDPLQAHLTAEAGIAIMKVAFPRWVDSEPGTEFGAVMRECAAELQSALTL